MNSEELYCTPIALKFLDTDLGKVGLGYLHTMPSRARKGPAGETVGVSRLGDLVHARKSDFAALLSDKDVHLIESALAGACIKKWVPLLLTSKRVPCPLSFEMDIPAWRARRENAPLSYPDVEIIRPVRVEVSEGGRFIRFKGRRDRLVVWFLLALLATAFAAVAYRAIATYPF